VIYAGSGDIDFAGLPLYRKLPRPVSFVASTDVFPDGTKMMIRTLEGDIDTVAGTDLYIMIGLQGEAYPIIKDKFEMGYHVLNERGAPEAAYSPVVLNRDNGECRELLPFSRMCVPKDNKLVRAKELEKDAKVFTYWDTEKYFRGNRGDYLVANEGDYDDCYIVRRDIFLDNYEPCL
jgi:phosphoglycolate phosphatase